MNKTIKLPSEVVDKFKDKHDNLSQAVRELIKKEQLNENNLRSPR